MAPAGIAATHPPSNAGTSKAAAMPGAKKRPPPSSPAPESSRHRLAQAPLRPKGPLAAIGAPPKKEAPAWACPSDLAGPTLPAQTVVVHVYVVEASPFNEETDR
eukprot:2466990-Pyramimonas_sp.AAC.1